MLVLNEDRVQANTVIAKAYAAESEPQEFLAAIDGHIYIEPEPEGGYKAVVRREDVEEWVTDIPASARLRVDKGDRVEVGTQLTEGSKNPREVLRIQGREAAQMYLLDEVQKVYRSQGVSIHDKHIEVIIRQLLRRVRILRSGDTDMLLGELEDRFVFDEANEAVVAQGGEPARGEPVLLGVTKASLNTDSFLAAASFQETTRVLTDAAVRGAKDGLRGLKENVIIGKLIPVGTGFEERRRAMEAARPEPQEEFDEEYEEEEAEAEIADEDLLFENEQVFDMGDLMGDADAGEDFGEDLDLAA